MTVFDIEDIQHFFTEFKNRFIFCLFGFFCNLCLLYNYKEDIFFLLASELREPSLIATDVTEFWNVMISMCLFFAFYFSYITFLIQLNFFFVPAFHKSTFYTFLQISFLSFFSCVLTAIVNFCFIYPSLCTFYSSYHIEEMDLTNYLDISLEPRISELFNFFFELFISLLLMFHVLSFFIYFLFKINLCFVSSLKKLFYGLFVIYALFFPTPEYYYQFFLALSLFILFHLFLIGCFIKDQYKKQNLLSTFHQGK